MPGEINFKLPQVLDFATRRLRGALSALNGGTGLSSPGASGNLLTSNGTGWVSSVPTNKLSAYQFTDVTDITLSSLPTQANLGTAASITIPTKGWIGLSLTGIVNQAVASGGVVYLGIRIGGTNYYPTSQGTNTMMSFKTAATGNVNMLSTGVQEDSGTAGNWLVWLPIEGLAIPTGAQTVQPIVAKASANAMIIKGTVATSRFNIMTVDHN